jgi:transcriptional regulator with XRE-family HTH domain
MNIFRRMWKKLMVDKQYREEYAIAMLKRMIPYQTRAIRKKRGWSQAQLAEAANLTQGVISRAEDPDYGNLTLTTIGRIAAGYDLAVIVRFVSFSDLVRFSETLSEQEFRAIPTFAEDHEPSEPKAMGAAAGANNGLGSKREPQRVGIGEFQKATGTEGIRSGMSGRNRAEGN